LAEYKESADEELQKILPPLDFEILVRQAQALRYAAQWARLQLADFDSGDTLGNHALIDRLYDATTAAINEVQRLKQTRVAFAAPFVDLSS